VPRSLPPFTDRTGLHPRCSRLPLRAHWCFPQTIAWGDVTAAMVGKDSVSVTVKGKGAATPGT